jgi:hypothetical protein
MEGDGLLTKGHLIVKYIAITGRSRCVKMRRLF